jgi:hypothetical protein
MRGNKNNSGLTPVLARVKCEPTTFVAITINVTDYFLKKQLNQETGDDILPKYVTDYKLFVVLIKFFRYLLLPP